MKNLLASLSSPINRGRQPARFRLMLFTGIAVLQFSVCGQQTYTITGTISDEAGESLPGAAIFITPAQIGVVSNTRGNFTISSLTKGEHQITASFLGYNDFHQRIYIDEDIELNIKLYPATLSLQEVVVKDTHAEMRKKEESLNVEVINDEYLKKNLGGSLMNSLERLPGVTTIDIGSGQSKPVIRGLGFNRVVVVENHIKHEAQQWGADHGLEIDQYAADNIEVIKGPSSLMYGSDAIGGIIHIKHNEVPLKNSVGGKVDLTAKSNNNLLGTSIALFGRKELFFADFRATLLDYGDYKVPTETVDIYGMPARLYNNQLRNTAGQEQNLHFSAGVVRNRFQSRLFVSNVNSKSGFFANAHGLEPIRVDTLAYDRSDRDIMFPHQQVNHFKVVNTSKQQWQNLTLETNLGFQHNIRQEKNNYFGHGHMPPVFPDTLPFPSTLEREFDKTIYSGNLKVTYRTNEKNQFTYGANAEIMNNSISGGRFIIPAFQQRTFGGFVHAKHTLNANSFVQAGVRYDYGKVITSAYYDWFPTPVPDDNGDTIWINLQRAYDLDRSFQNLSWSVGYNYFNDKWLVKLNVGKSFRMPTAQELGANGVNYHYFRYEIGDSAINPEISYQADAGIEFNGKKFAVGLSPFVNYFTNYIYLNPTDSFDTEHGAGDQICHYVQSRVYRFGGEIHAHYQVAGPLQVGIMGEYVYSIQLSGEKKYFTLPFSPAPSGIFNIKYLIPDMRFIENAYANVDYRLTATQKHRLPPPEESTKGYQVVNLGFGGDIMVKNQRLNISLQVHNLFDIKYFNHTSFYRLINVPEVGRNIIINVSIPFSGTIKQK